MRFIGFVLWLMTVYAFIKPVWAFDLTEFLRAVKMAQTKEEISPYLNDIKQLDENGKYALTSALWEALESKSNPEIIGFLLESGAEVKILVGEDNVTLLEYVAKSNQNEAVIAEILKFGEYDKRELTRALHKALYHNPNDKITELLIEKGAGVNETWKLPNGDEKITTWKYLEEALHNDNPEVLKVLMKYGIDVRYEDKSWGSAVNQMAWYNKNPAMLKLVLESGANVNAYGRGETALHSLCKKEYPNIEMLNLLLEYGIDIEAKDRRGVTPLMVCSEWNMSADAVKVLLAKGANVNAVDVNGYGFLFKLLEIANPDEERTKARLEIINEAVKYGVDVNMKGGRVSLLYYALMENAGPEVIKLLLDKGADYKSVPLKELDFYLNMKNSGAEYIKAMYE